MAKLRDKISNFGREETGENAKRRALIRDQAKLIRRRLFTAQQDLDALIRDSTDRLADVPEAEWLPILGELAAKLLPFLATAELLPGDDK